MACYTSHLFCFWASIVNHKNGSYAVLVRFSVQNISLFKGVMQIRMCRIFLWLICCDYKYRSTCLYAILHHKVFSKYISRHLQSMTFQYSIFHLHDISLYLMCVFTILFTYLLYFL